MSKKVSVIIPVYNAEKYITQCIESFLSQALQECEFIFVNDGSKDNSKQIIEKYQKLDSRIKLINQENQGVSNARNTGLHVATGEYVGFVDADDYIEKDMYEILYNSAKQSNCDVVISNLKWEMEGHKVITKYPFPVDIVLKKDYIEQELLPYFLKTDNLNTAVNKIYRNKLIRENSVKFPEKVTLGEDGIFNMQFFSNAINMKYINYVGYHYREVAGSATRNISEKDYFKRAVEVYTMELPKIYTGKIDKARMRQLKSIKLIDSVMSYIHIYFTPSKDVNFSKRYKYVKNMIHNKYVREALLLYYKEIYSTLGRYEKLLIDMIKRKSTVGLYFATSYSRFRNR
ncbi:glycosyltransferase [Bacillus rhizoplanae]|uniref:glycosyltransferase n=1 Tax=Bacillus rhizoplanae TaxID=2880966 RepID=UPI003D258AE7